MLDKSASLLRYENLIDYSSLEELITEGESEDLFYECKSPSTPKVGQDTKAQLAEAISGFSNTEGGILIYGIETSKLAHAATDTMIQITKVGTISTFAKRIVNSIPTLTMPAVTKFEYKVFKERRQDTAGVLIIYVPPSMRPVQSLADNRFHFRGGDQFVVAPYSIIERLFSSVTTPDINIELGHYKFISDSVKPTHQLSILISNESLAVGKATNLWMEIKNATNVEEVLTGMTDASDVNNDRKVYTNTVSETIHHKLTLVSGKIGLVLKPRKRKVTIVISVYSEGMMPKSFNFECQFNSKSLSSIKKTQIQKN